MEKKDKDQELRELFKERGFSSIKKSVDTSINEVRTGMLGQRKVLPTKWKRLNKNLLGGLQPGKMYVYWSFEMPGHQQILRAGSKDVKKQVLDLLSVESKLSEEEYTLYKEKVSVYKKYPILFNNIPRTIDYIKDTNVEMTTALPDRMIINIFDHSRLVAGRADNELQKLDRLSKGCMWMQAKMGVINILLSQLNRNIEQEHRAKAQYQPLLTDLFGGDSIGQDAHVVMMLQRPYDLYGITELYCSHDPVGLLAVHIEKNRDGLLGMLPFEADMSTFTINERT